MLFEFELLLDELDELVEFDELDDELVELECLCDVLVEVVSVGE